MWGTTTVDGVEVLNLNRVYHTKANSPANAEELFRFLGVWDDVKDYDGKGLRSAWFTLNKNNGPEEPDINTSFVVDNLNSMWWDTNDGPRPSNLTLTTSIVVGDRFDGQRGVPVVNWSAPKEVVAQSVIDNFESLWLTNRITQEGVGVINKGPLIDPTTKVETPDEDDLSPDDPWLAVISRYALRDVGIACTVKDVEVGLSGGDAVFSNGVINSTAVVTIEIPYHAFTETDAVVIRILDDMDTKQFPKSIRSFFNFNDAVTKGVNYSNEHVTQSDTKRATFYEDSPESGYENIVTREYIEWEYSSPDVSIYDSYWLKSGNSWYLRAAVIDNPSSFGTTHVDLNTYIFSLLDTGYRKKKVKWYKKALAFVVFIIAVILAFVPGGQLFSSQLMAAAFAIMVGALVVSLVTLALSAMGATDWAMAFAWVSGAIEPLVTIAAIAIIVTNFATKGVEAAIEHYVEQYISEYIFDLVLGVFGPIGEIIADAMDGKLNTDTIQTINKIAGVYANVQLKKLDTIASKNKDLQAEYDKLAEEGAMETDVMKGYMNTYANPYTVDNSIFAGTYDLPYEPSGGTHHTGSSQKTTLQALRKAEYTDPMFEGMRFV